MANEKANDTFAALMQPVKTQSASEAIYEQIKDLILQGKLKPGDRLPTERALIQLLSRSRPTIREALRMLGRDGFIHTVPGGSGGAIVQMPTTNVVTENLDAMLQIGNVTKEELGEFRLHNDAMVAGWAAQRRTSADLEALEAILAETDRAIQAMDWQGFMGQDPKFHVQLARAGKNEVAAIMSQVLSEMSVPITIDALSLMSPEDAQARARSILDMHRDIFAAVQKGDPKAAEEAMTYHIRHFIQDNL